MPKASIDIAYRWYKRWPIEVIGRIEREADTRGVDHDIPNADCTMCVRRKLFAPQQREAHNLFVWIPKKFCAGIRRLPHHWHSGHSHMLLDFPRPVILKDNLSGAKMLRQWIFTYSISFGDRSRHTSVRRNAQDRGEVFRVRDAVREHSEDTDGYSECCEKYREPVRQPQCPVRIGVSAVISGEGHVDRWWRIGRRRVRPVDSQPARNRVILLGVDQGRETYWSSAELIRLMVMF